MMLQPRRGSRDCVAARTVCVVALLSTSTALSQGAQPFCLEQQEGGLNLDTGAWNPDWKDVIVARRNDGSSVRVEAIGPVSSRLRIRELSTVDGNVITVFETQKMKTTWPSGGEGWFSRPLFPINAPDCRVRATDELGRETERVLRLDGVGNQLVVVTEGHSGKFTFTSWRSPQLGCTELRYRAEQEQPDGSRRITVDLRSTRLQLQEPDPTLFAIDADLAEVKPSHALMRFVDSLRIPLDAKDRDSFRREGKELDRR